MRPAVGQPVLAVSGGDDPALPADGAAPARGDHVVGELTEHVLPGVGHFPHEEGPAAFTRLLLDWLATACDRDGARRSRRCRPSAVAGEALRPRLGDLARRSARSRCRRR